MCAYQESTDDKDAETTRKRTRSCHSVELFVVDATPARATPAAQLVSNEGELLLLNKLIKHAHVSRSADVERILNDYLFYRNDNCKYLVGKAVALKQNFHYWWKIHAVPGASSYRSYIAHLGAAHRLCHGWCYCKTSDPVCDGDCITLTTIFGCTESTMLDAINEVLRATYNTDDDKLIECIRAHARKCSTGKGVRLDCKR